LLKSIKTKVAHVMAERVETKRAKKQALAWRQKKYSFKREGEEKEKHRVSAAQKLKKTSCSSTR